MTTKVYRSTFVLYSKKDPRFMDEDAAVFDVDARTFQEIAKDENDGVTFVESQVVYELDSKDVSDSVLAGLNLKKQKKG